MTDVVSRLAGSVAAYCATVTVPITHNENGLTALMSLAWAADAHLSATAISRVLYSVRVSFVWLFGLACLGAGVSVVLTAVLIAGAVAILNALVDYQFTVYPFLVTMTLLWVGLCSLLYASLRVASVPRAAVLAGFAGLTAAWLTNLRTSSVPIIVVLFALTIGAAFVWRLRTQRVRGFPFATACAAGFVIALAGASSALLLKSCRLALPSGPASTGAPLLLSTSETALPVPMP